MRDKVPRMGAGAGRPDYPGAGIQINVKEETDEDGDLIYSAIISREDVVPRNDIPL